MQMLQHPRYVMVRHGSAVVTVDKCVLHEAALQRQCCRKVDHVCDEIRCGVSRPGDFQTAARVSDEYVARLDHFERRVESPGHRGLFIDTLAVARYVDGERVVAELVKFWDCPAPTLGAVKSTVNQYEAHVSRTPSTGRCRRSPAPSKRIVPFDIRLWRQM
jgi:DNA-directed RNA polymerase subunit N (RpoN/RPB10)